MQIEKINRKGCLIEKLWKISVIDPNFPLIRKREKGNRFFLLDKHREKRGIERITFPCLMHPQLLLRGFSSFLKTLYYDKHIIWHRSYTEINSHHYENEQYQSHREKVFSVQNWIPGQSQIEPVSYNCFVLNFHLYIIFQQRLWVTIVPFSITSKNSS